MLNKLLSENKEIIITGDFNFDTLSDAPLSKKWSELIQDLGLVQMINEPTRVLKYSATLIDQIIVSHPEFVRTAKVAKCGNSDHFPVCMTYKKHFGMKP